MEKIKVTENYQDTSLTTVDYMNLRKILRSVWSTLTFRKKKNVDFHCNKQVINFSRLILTLYWLR